MIEKVLKELHPFVIVVGSYARGENHSGSDIDLYIKRRPQEELDNDWYNNVEEHYIDKVIEVFENNNLKWDSLFISYIHTNDLPVQIEASPLFKIHKDTPIKTIELFGVKMESAIDDKDISIEDKIEM